MNKGFTMLEMTITAFVLVTGVLASYYIFSQIIVATSIASSRLTAAYLAQEGLEIIRNIRDTNWLKGLAWDNTFNICSYGCEADYTTGTAEQVTPLAGYFDTPLLIDTDGFYNYYSGLPTKFKRKITITPDPGNIDVLEVSVLVEWQDRGRNYSLTTGEYLYNWY